MLKQHNEFFKSLMRVSDLLFISLAWWLAYGLRFYTNLFVEAENFIFRHYVIAWIMILLVWAGVSELLDFYRPRRLSTHRREIADLIKGSALSLLIFLGILFLVREIVLSRIVVILFWFTSLVFLNLSHISFREGLRLFRRTGHNLRHMLILGAPAQTQQLLQKLQLYRHLGHHIVGVFLTQDPASDKEWEGVRIIPELEELLAIIRSGKVDGAFVALPLEQASKLREIQQWLGDEPLELYFVPDLGELAKMRGNIEEFDGMQIISLQASPLYGWNSLLKRTMDIALGGFALLCFSPVMALIAVGIKLTSSGPILYRQERMGLDGEPFEMLKFRTMVQGAEHYTGPVWAANDDPRVTTLGLWLRRTSLDELPQLINVLRGEMSLVGPRPERPPLIEEFRKSIPKYMLRHKVKAGMTGWAQVNGWRGNTSLERRIEHDLDYIENWSLWRDVTILARTLRVGFRHHKAGNF
jgi:Undecaprenyl-phosphate glucose phosphotransferase